MESKDEIIQAYQSGMTQKDIVSTYDVTRNMLRYTLLYEGVPIRRSNSKLTVDAETQKAIVEAYQQPSGFSELKDEFGVGTRQLYAILGTHKIDLHPVGWASGIRNRKYEWDLDFFTRERPEVYYWAGFILADGCLQVVEAYYRNQIEVGISTKDLEHLKAFCDAVQISQEAINFRSDTDMCRIALNKVGIADDVQRFGIVPNKTYDWHRPNIPEDMLPHFLRGWFDGDGSISGDTMTLCGNKAGTKYFLSKLQDLGYEGGAGFYTDKDIEDPCWDVLRIGGRRQCLQVWSILDQKGPRLQRKADRFKILAEFVPSHSTDPIPVWKVCSDTFEDIEKFDSLSDAGTSVDMGHTTLHNAVRYKWLSGGFYWRYDDEVFDPTQIRSNAKPVLQLDPETKEPLREYSSMKLAAQDVSGDPSSLSKACRGKLETSAGYSWAYADIT